jgi:CBS domain-containing protein
MASLARDLMTRDVKTVTPELNIKAFAEFLLHHHISGAPVLGPEGRVIGLATENDLIVRDAAVHLPTMITILDAYFVLETPRRQEQELHKILGQTVEDIMNRDVISVSPETSLRELATIMHEHACHLLPVVENGRLVGVIGKADVVRGIAQEE